MSGRAAGLRYQAKTFAAGFAILGAVCLSMPAYAADKLASLLDLTSIDPAPVGSKPLLQAAAGVTAIAGRVLAIDNTPIVDVLVTDGAARTKTDADGRFLLTNVESGESTVALDGRHAKTPSGMIVDYGYYETRVSADAQVTTSLPFVDWLTPIDHAHDVTISSPLAAPVKVTTPAIPDLELRIPAGAVITDPDHKPVTRVGLTKISVHRPPFPLPKNVHVPVYFTAQPGGSVISSADGKWLGAQVVYPNYYHHLPRAQETFWKYDPDNGGWFPYGVGTVSADGRQVVPDENTRIYEFSGAMISLGPLFCKYIGIFCPHSPPNPGGDPVDLTSGSFYQNHTDMSLSDVLPISVTRVYTSSDTTGSSFGAGMSSAYDITLWTTSSDYQSLSLALPGGMSVPYVRTSPGNSYTNAIFQSTARGAYYNSTVSWNGAGWTLARNDGMIMTFPIYAPVQTIQDRFGNTISFVRNSNGQITQVTSPNGKFISFQWTNNVITSATDNLGRTFQYSYDPNYQMLEEVTDPDGGVTQYGWSNGQIQTVTDARTYTFITNQYDSNLRVHTQTLANGSSTYTFTYTLGSNCNTVGNQTECNVTATSLQDPNGNVRKVTFDPSGNMLTDDRAVGTSAEIDTEYCLAGEASLNASVCPTSSGGPTGYPVDIFDGLNRDTHFTYDNNANVLSVTYLYGSSNASPCTSTACTYNYTYSPNFNLLTSVTDPLSHTTQITRPEPLEEATAVTDAMSNTFSFGYNLQGQVQTFTDAVSPANTWTLGYNVQGDLSSITDPLNRTQTISTDAIGRPIKATDPLGNSWSSTWDPLKGVYQTTSPLGALTTLNYDADGNTSSVVDALTHKTSFAYTTSDQWLSTTDPDLLESQAQTYDANGNLKQWEDRKSQVTKLNYDALNRISTVDYADGSVVSYTWDKGNRLTQVSDTAGNMISRFYDGLNDLACETPNNVSTLAACQSAGTGTVIYTYDAAARRQTMTVKGQSQVTYTFDNDNRLENIVQGTSSVIKTYDNDSRLKTLTLPDGIKATYGFDNASELTGIVYTSGSSTVGTLYYLYDNDGRVTSRSGSLFQSVMPTAVAGAAYDPDNRLCAWNSASASCSSPTLTWDNNGNATYFGGATLTWDARNRLTAVSGLNLAFTYDALSRRLTQTSSGTTTSYVYDFENVVQELQSGTASANLLTGLNIDEWFARTPAGSTASSFLTDNLGSVVALASTSASIATSYSYTAFGATTVTGTASSSTYGFTGREDSLNQLYYYRARYYSPLVDRFISEDPIGFEGGINKYAYVGNDPINYRDPSGLCYKGDFSCNMAMRAANMPDAWQKMDQEGPGTGPTACQLGFLALTTALSFESEIISDASWGAPSDPCNPDPPSPGPDDPPYPYFPGLPPLPGPNNPNPYWPLTPPSGPHFKDRA